MFKSAKIKLTALYLLIIMFVSISFSVAMFKILTSEVDRISRIQRYRFEHRMEGRPVLPPSFRMRENNMMSDPDPEVIADFKSRIITFLVSINIGILFLSGGLGYLLAGKTLKPIQEMLEEQNRFITDASHDLRTPITALKSSMEVFLRDEKPNIKDAKNLIKENLYYVDNLSSLTDSLILLAQYETPNGHMTFDKVNISTVIRDSLNAVKPKIIEKHIQIESNINGYEITGDKFSLVDLFSILLDNAIKYSHEKSKIQILSEVQDKSIIIIVKDEGIGISEKDLPFIFDRFYRADKSRSKSNNYGYGLGLSIAKKIVEMHKGDISVESQLNKGSAFMVKLPGKSVKGSS